jgi:hypothetical protein
MHSLAAAEKNCGCKGTDTKRQLELIDDEDPWRCRMDDDRSWLKNPIFPRPPAVPRFSRAELRLVEDERLAPSKRAEPRRVRSKQIVSEVARAVADSEVPQSRRMA